MRILVISDLPHFVVGGAEIQAARLIEAWLDRGHEVMCFGRRMGSRSARIGGHNIQTRRIRVFQMLGRPGRALSYFLSLTMLLLRFRSWPDVIYTRFLNEAAATVALLKHMGILHCILVPTPANAGVNGDDKVIAALPFKRQLVRVLDTQCDAINLIAPTMAEDLLALGFSGKTFCFIPNGINIPPFDRRVNADGLRLIFIGRLTSQKGLDILLSALSHTEAEPGEGFELRIAGDGPDRQELGELASRLQLSGKIVFLGELSQTAVQDLLQEGDVFILPSRYEGLSNAGLEAMARGLPLVLTRCGGLDTYIDDSNGWVVPVNDEASLATTISRVLATPRAKLLQMGYCAHTIAQRNFSISKVSEQYLDLFTSLRFAKERNC